MKKLEFKPEDFLTLTLNRLSAASYAQTVFDQWYKENIENAPIVYGQMAGWGSKYVTGDTLKGIVVCIEPIEQPKKEQHQFSIDGKTWVNAAPEYTYSSYHKFHRVLINDEVTFIETFK